MTKLTYASSDELEKFLVDYIDENYDTTVLTNLFGDDKYEEYVYYLIRAMKEPGVSHLFNPEIVEMISKEDLDNYSND